MLWRAITAAITPMAPKSPPPRSPIGMPERVGGIVGSPVIDMPPPIAWITWSKAGRWVSGPVSPKPDTVQVMIRGLIALSVS